MLPRPRLARPNLPRPKPLRCWRPQPPEQWPARSASAFDLLLQRLEARAIKPAHRLDRGLVAQLWRRIVVGKAAIERAGPLQAAALAVGAGGYGQGGRIVGDPPPRYIHG